VGSVTEDAFKRAMRCRADTVHLVTYRAATGDIEGMTATALTALSVTPPSVLFCVGHTSRARDAIRRDRSFGVSILSHDEAELAAVAGRSGSNKALDPALLVAALPELTPVLKRALATLQCKLVEDREIYTHTVFVGEVLDASVAAEGDPLLHYLGGFATISRVQKR
jgi:flavin reductase